MGIMPITGIPLPFVSYGGTAVLVFFGAVGLALSVGRPAEIPMTDVQPQAEPNRAGAGPSRSPSPSGAGAAQPPSRPSG